MDHGQERPDALDQQLDCPLLTVQPTEYAEQPLHLCGSLCASLLRTTICRSDFQSVVDEFLVSARLAGCVKKDGCSGEASGKLYPKEGGGDMLPVIMAIGYWNLEIGRGNPVDVQAQSTDFCIVPLAR